MTVPLIFSIVLFMFSIVFVSALLAELQSNTNNKWVSILALILIIITVINIGLSIFNTVKDKGKDKTVSALSVVFGCIFSFVFLIFGAVNFKYKHLTLHRKF
jgi:hypothetical protein